MCQRIPKLFQAETSSAVMGVESEGDDGLYLDEDEEDEEGLASIGSMSTSRTVH